MARTPLLQSTATNTVNKFSGGSWSGLDPPRVEAGDKDMPRVRRITSPRTRVRRITSPRPQPLPGSEDYLTWQPKMHGQLIVAGPMHRELALHRGADPGLRATNLDVPTPPLPPHLGPRLVGIMVGLILLKYLAA